MGFGFLDWEEYPSNEELMEGLKEDIMYAYVSTTYLNGFINYVDIIGAYMTRRYKELEKDKSDKNPNDLSWEESCKLIDNNTDFHTNVSDCNKYDDIHILAKCGDYYYYFWSDCDCSNSCIGKFSKSRFESKNKRYYHLKRKYSVSIFGIVMNLMYVSMKMNILNSYLKNSLQGGLLYKTEEE